MFPNYGQELPHDCALGTAWGGSVVEAIPNTTHYSVQEAIVLFSISKIREIRAKVQNVFEPLYILKHQVEQVASSARLLQI